MTKTLTEQWKDGELKQAFYYLKFPDTDISEIYNLYDMEKFRYVQDSEKIDVLYEVPSYDEYQLLKKEIDSLKEQIHSMLFTDDVVQERYDKAVQKTHTLEKKLEIATKALKDLCGTPTSWDEVRCGEYMAKQKLKEIEGVK